MRIFEGDPTWHAARALSRNGSTNGGTGRLVELESGKRPGLPVLVYVPSRLSDNPRILVSVHGVSRNAAEHVELFRHLADWYGVVVVAPTFGADLFPDYQRLGRKGKGPRADLALIRALNEIGAKTGWNTAKIDMFGFSGGAQFAHRFAFVHAQRVRRLVLGAAGWYTMPDLSQGYPYGCADAAGLEGARLNIVAAVQLRTLVMVGEHDDRPDDAELNRSKRVRRVQGRSRIDRARNWVAAMSAFAHDLGVASEIEFVELRGVDHSFHEAVTNGSLATRVFEYCYG